MKFLIMPGLPLLGVAVITHNPDSTASVILTCATAGLFSFGGAFLIGYAIIRYFRNHTNTPL